jgi:hypothetical protein
MEGRKVTLFVDQDKTWNVDFNFTSNNQYTLSGGWSKFRAHNNLKFGDICVFMLNKCKETISFQVAIFSLEKDMNTPYFEGICFFFFPLFFYFHLLLYCGIKKISLKFYHIFLLSTLYQKR